uniref:toxin glutamine deamidase domain-containing protein n=1 Tax=Streptomyces anthocyanicus TaxID=68174 RepID=UPI002F9162B3
MKSTSALSQAVDSAVAEVAGVDGQDWAAVDASPLNCVTLLLALEQRLYPASGVAHASRDRGRGPYISPVRAGVSLDDLVLAGAGVEQRLARGPGWSPVGSWEALTRTVTEAGPGATGLVVRRRRRGAGHALAVHYTSEGIRWVEPQASPGSRVSARPPGWAPVDTRAVVVDPQGRVVMDAGEAWRAAASRLTDALTDGPAEPEYIGKIGLEVEDVHPVRSLRMALSYKMLLATHSSGLRLEIDHGKFWRGEDGQLYPSRQVAQQAAGTGAKPEKHPVIEIVTPPLSAMRADVGGISGQDGISLLISVRETLDLVDERSRSMALGSLFGGADWELTDAGRSVMVMPSPAGADHAAYTQLTVGVPVGGLKHLLHTVEARSVYPALAPLIAEGRRFGEAVAARFARKLLGRSVPEYMVPFLTDVAGVDEVHGYAWLAFQHAAAVPFWYAFYSAKLAKNMLAAALRNPFDRLHSSLSGAVRDYLEADFEAILRIFESHLDDLLQKTAGSLNMRLDFPRPAMIKVRQLDSSCTVKDYFTFAIQGRLEGRRRVTQDDIFGIEAIDYLDDVKGPRSLRLSLLELRAFSAPPRPQSGDPNPVSNRMTGETLKESFKFLVKAVEDSFTQAARFVEEPVLTVNEISVLLEHTALASAMRTFLVQNSGLEVVGRTGGLTPVLQGIVPSSMAATVARALVHRDSSAIAAVESQIQKVYQILRGQQSSRFTDALIATNKVVEQLSDVRVVFERKSATSSLAGRHTAPRIPTHSYQAQPRTRSGAAQVHGSGGRGRGEPPVGLGGLVGGDAAAAGVGVDWYVPLPDEGGVSLAAGLVHVPREVEQPVAARLELTRLLARVVLHDPGVAARVVDSGVRVYVVGRGTPIGDVMRGAGVEEARLTLDGRLAHTLRAYTDPGSRTVFVAEENLLGVDTRTAVRVHSDGYSSTVHELAHLLYTYGLTDDDRALVRGTYQQRLEEGADAVWADGPRRSLDGEPADNYSSLDPEEYFAQATNAYFHANTGHDPLTGRPRNNGTRWIQDNEPGLLPLLTRVYGTPTPHHPYNPTTRTAAENSIWQGFADFTALTQQTTPDPAGRPRFDAPPEGSPAADPPPPYPRDDSASEAAEDDALPDIPPPSYPEAVAAGTPPPTANTAPAAPLAAKREPWRPKPGMTLPIGVVRYPQHFDDMTQLTALTEQALYEAGTNRARGPRHHRAVQDAIAHAATTIRTHIDARSPKITLTNADLLLTLPNDPYLGVWMTVVQGLANTLQHRIKVILPTTTQKDPETRLEVCPQ